MQQLIERLEALVDELELELMAVEYTFSFRGGSIQSVGDIPRDTDISPIYEAIQVLKDYANAPTV